jgi:hypothetical protein
MGEAWQAAAERAALLASWTDTLLAVGGITPGLEKITECIPYVRQDQVPHIQ